jgi:predicted nucleic acid-binding protein
MPVRAAMRHMRVVVDTSVWSLGLRRRVGALAGPDRVVAMHWRELVRDGRAAMIGAIRQELLSGVPEREQFDRIRDYLRGFEDELLMPDDYEAAARFHTVCRTAGVAGSPIDFLICAAAVGRGLSVFTTDADFGRYALHLPVRLYTWSGRPR